MKVSKYLRGLVLLLALSVLTNGQKQCPPGQAADPQGNCIDVNFIEGCAVYSSKQQCSQCEFNYVPLAGICDYKPKDQAKCCLAFGQNGECSQCQTGLFLDAGACKQSFLVGCISKVANKCINCASDFYLKDGLCVPGVEMCSAYADNGACRDCKQGFFLHRGACVQKKIIGCNKQQSDRCTECYPPFTNDGGICKVAGCTSFTDYGCSTCLAPYYLKGDGACYQRERGCEVYRRGECVFCRPPFLLSAGKCQIQGCSAYTDKGLCGACQGKYTLVGGLCALPNCLESKNGRCLICEAGYHIHNGECLKPLQFCVDFVEQVCRQCAQGFYLGVDNHCRPFEFGCSKYQKGVCAQCSQPFTLANNKCFIDGCQAYQKNGCQQCAQPYRLQNGICRLDNCQVAQAGKCIKCENSHVNRLGVCVLRDVNCQNYDQDGFCQKCSVGFHPADGNCERDIAGCIDYARNGKCTRCQTDMYLTEDSKCLPVQPGCVYSQGRCASCNPPFSLLNDACFIEGCSKYFLQGCAQCSYPYALTQLKACGIPNCLKIDQGKCTQCHDDFLLKPDGSCFRKIPYCSAYALDFTCSACLDTYFISETGLECVPRAPGCIYNKGKCVRCIQPFIFDNGKCKIAGCSRYNLDGCEACLAPFVESPDRGCRIPNCQALVSTGQLCQSCTAGYVVQSGSCQRNIANCQSYNGDVCKICRKGFYLSKSLSECLPEKPGCIYENGVCSSCKPPFNMKNSNCMIEGCLTYDQFGCTKCLNDKFILYDRICRLPQCAVIEDNKCKFCAKDYILRREECVAVDIYCAKYNADGICEGCLVGYYLEKNGYCKKEKPGSNYINGQIVSCRQPFSFDVNTKSCGIDGCEEFFDSGCKVCTKPYTLNYNGCKLDKCVKSFKGKCIKCEQGLVSFKGVCQFADINCLRYSDAGQCQECRAGYLVIPDNTCMKKAPGCIYSGAVCTSCYKPFVFNGLGCQIEGCLKMEEAGCSQCTYPYDGQKDNSCAIPFCARTSKGRCEKCVAGYHAKKGICQVDDPNCLAYASNGNCQNCIKGYSVLDDGSCHFRDIHCRRFNLMDCLECDDGYFVNVKKTCSAVQRGCSKYVDGKCTECSARFFLWDNICKPFRRGCLQYEQNKCVKCEDNYNLKGGNCMPLVADINYNDIQVDEDFDSAVFEGTTTKVITKYVSQTFLSPVSVIGRLVYSSIFGTEFQKCQLGAIGWKAKTAAAGEYVGYAVQNAQTFYSIELQSGADGSYLKEFQIEYTLDGKRYRRLPTVFDGSKTANGTPISINFTPIYAIQIRIIVRTFSLWPHFRFEFYYSDANKIIETPASGQETEISAYIRNTVDLKMNYQVESNIRNFFNPQRDCKGMETCWVGVEFCEAKNITKLIIQESKENKGSLVQYYLDYSSDGAKFICFNGCTPIEATQKIYVLSQPVLAKSIRVHPVKWNGQPDIKFSFEWQK